MRSFNPFDVDFFKLVGWLIPRRLRVFKVVIIFKACVYPLLYLHNKLLVYRDAKLYEIMITSQVCYLERLLNDRFDYTARRIYISDAEWHLPLFLFQEDELKPVPLFRDSEGKHAPLFTDGEAGAVLNDFIIMIPVSVTFSEPELRGLVDRFKLFGTKYTIQLF